VLCTKRYGLLADSGATALQRDVILGNIATGWQRERFSDIYTLDYVELG